MEETSQNNNVGSSSSGGGKIWGVIVGIIVLVAIGFLLTRKTGEPVVSNPVTTPNDTTTPPVTPPVDKKSIYKDGTYTAIGDYNSPGGANQIKVTVTLVNDNITDATVTSVVAKGPPSVAFQGQFISGFKQYVIGKNITEVTLSRVSGSSLTPIGWNDAVAKIQTQAKA